MPFFKNTDSYLTWQCRVNFQWFFWHMYMSKHTEPFWMVTHYLAVSYLYSFLLQFPIQAKRDKIKVRLLELQILSIINIVFGEFWDHPLIWRFTIRTHKTQHIVVFMANTYYSNVVWTYSLIIMKKTQVKSRGIQVQSSLSFSPSQEGSPHSSPNK